MSRDVQRSLVPITSTDQLVDYFRKGIKSPDERKVGTEHEKFLLHDNPSLDPVPYEGDSGISAVFQRLMDQFGWEPTYDGPSINALTRPVDGDLVEAITTEPGGQFELSGAPYRFLSQTEAELDRHFDEMRSVCNELGLLCVGTGLNPLLPVDKLPWMPKSRYRIMRAYMTRVGNLGHWMMKATCTVQANFDYTSEDDASDILHTALRISPVISAMFAHSPIWNQKPSGFMSTRCHIWTDTDNDRCGFPPSLLNNDPLTFRDYVEYALDVPMYFIHRDGAYVDMSGHSFRRFLQDGFQGHQATMGDFELHLSTLFPEVRLKRYIEVRGADMGPRSHVLALPALWKGILYDPTSRSSARSLLQDLSPDERSNLFTHSISWSLNAPTPPSINAKHPLVRHLAKTLTQLSYDGLKRLSKEDNPIAQPDETNLLQPLFDTLESPSLSPAHDLLDLWRSSNHDTHALMRSLTLF